MKFAYAQQKSAGNREKHGIDFETAQALWADKDMLEIPAKSLGEERWLIVAMLDGKHWTAVFTKRRNAIRIISVRRSRKSEVERYESHYE